MEIGPTCHYVMGGVEVDADTQESSVKGLYAVGECSGGMHGSNRLGGNSLGDLLVFGKRAGEYASEYAARAGRAAASGRGGRRHALAAASALAPFELEGGENPYSIQSDLQQPMNDLVGIIRNGDELEQALKEIEGFKVRAEHAVGGGSPAVQPGLAPRDRPAQHAAWSRSASRRRRSSARSPAAGTPATTSRSDRRVVGQQEPRPASRRARATARARPSKPLPVMPDELKTYFEAK